LAALSGTTGYFCFRLRLLSCVSPQQCRVLHIPRVEIADRLHTISSGCFVGRLESNVLVPVMFFSTQPESLEHGMILAACVDPVLS
jgi:hypothetical protein